MLDQFVLKAEKIAEAGKSAKLSRPAVEALMRVFIIATGVINTIETPQKQVAEFNKVLSENLTSGTLSYKTIYNMMKQLKIPTKVMVEALWDANIKN